VGGDLALVAADWYILMGVQTARKIWTKLSGFGTADGIYLLARSAAPGKMDCTCHVHVHFPMLNDREFRQKSFDVDFLKNFSIECNENHSGR